MSDEPLDFGPDRASKDILIRLGHWASLKTGDPLPPNWGPILTRDLLDAIEEIKRRRDPGVVKRYLGVEEPGDNP